MNQIIKQLEKDYDVIMVSNPNCKTTQTKKEFILHWLNIQLKAVNDAIDLWKDEESIYKDSLKIRLNRKKEIEIAILENNEQ